MSSHDISDHYSPPETSSALPKIGFLTMLRLGIFNMGLGIMSLLTLGVLNRVMIDELQVPALFAAGTIAVHQFMAPARVWFGQMSDARPIFGYHRSSYIWIGILGMSITAFMAVQISWQLGYTIADQGWSLGVSPWVGLLALMFALYGLALSATSTPFTALLVDVSDEDTQSRLVGIGWSMLMVGIITGVIITAVVLQSLGDYPSIADLKTSINRLFIIAPGIVCGLAILSTFGIEKKYSRLRQRSQLANREDSITLKQAFKVLTASRQTALFFSFLLVLSLSLFMQDAVLEPYGGQVFGMKISETTQLNAFFGLGTLLGILGTGFFLTPRLGKKRTVRIGCLWAAICLVMLALSGLTTQPAILMGAVSCFGLASGILTTGAILLMLDLTIAETAGTFIGAWGLAQAIARGGATLLGGTVLSVGKGIMGWFYSGPIPENELLPAYSLVFICQAAGMLAAIAMISRVNIQEFQLNARTAITAALESDMD